MKRHTIFKLNIILSAFFIWLLNSNVGAQERTCGMTEYMKEKMKDPIYAKQYYKSQANFKAQLAKNLKNTNFKRKMNTIIIPVAVHFPGAQESDRSCLEALAQNQVDILNNDFTGNNTDISDWTAAQPFYPGVNTGAVDLLFCLATLNHPPNTDDDLVEGAPAVSIGYDLGNNDEDANWGGYMNFIVKDIGNGVLGYSPLGGSIANGQAVVMNLDAFGSGAGCPGSGIVPGAPFDLGRTVTHELGHFYNLLHTFSGNCNGDDNIADTPNQNQASNGCPSLGNVPACDTGEQVLFQSYMDYTDDRCMIMFSEGQTNVMEAFLMTLQPQFKPNTVECSGKPDFTLFATNNSEIICSPINDVVYDLSYKTTGGNTDLTTFSASSLPSGATATFNPTSITNDGNVTLTISNLSTASDGNYTINITSTGITTKTTSVGLEIDAAIPAIPNLIAPVNGQTEILPVPNLTWDVINDAASYTVETATDAAFTMNVTSNTVTTNSFQPLLLNGSTQYFWRVLATNSCGNSSYSNSYNFTTALITCNTYNSTQNDIIIPATGDNSHVITSKINIDSDVIVSYINVTVNVDHAWSGDIELKLISPDDTEVIMLANSTCDDGIPDIAVTFDDQANGPVQCSNTAPSVGGIIQPENPLSAFSGQSAKGDWVLVVTDDYPDEDGGTFLNYSINLCAADILSIDKFDIEKSLKLWPNPSNGAVNISFNSTNKEDVNISLYDLRGRLIDKQSFDNKSNIFSKTIKYGNLESSVYILNIENERQVINKRIIIE